MDVQQGRWTAEIDGDFVVFLIGAMAHDPVGSPEATRLLMTMSDMLGELLSDPSKGLLAFSTYGTAANGAVLIQYWRSFDALEAYALKYEINLDKRRALDKLRGEVVSLIEQFGAR